MEDEAKFSQATATGYVESAYGHKMNGKALASRKDGLISSFKVLGHFSSLLYPSASIVDAANSAARKATSFISSGKNERNIVGGGSHVDTSIRAGMFLFLINDNLIDERRIPSKQEVYRGTKK